MTRNEVKAIFRKELPGVRFEDEDLGFRAVVVDLSGTKVSREMLIRDGQAAGMDAEDAKVHAANLRDTIRR